MAVAVEWEPRAFDSSDVTGLSVVRGVRGSRAAEGAMVRWEVESACEAPSDGGAKSSFLAVLVTLGGKGVTSFLGAPDRKR